MSQPSWKPIALAFLLLSLPASPSGKTERLILTVKPNADTMPVNQIGFTATIKNTGSSSVQIATSSLCMRIKRAACNARVMRTQEGLVHPNKPIEEQVTESVVELKPDASITVGTDGLKELAGNHRFRRHVAVAGVCSVVLSYECPPSTSSDLARLQIDSNEVNFKASASAIPEK